MLTYSRLKGQGIFSLDINKNSLITGHARLASCKECFHISNRPLPIHVHSHEILSFLTQRLRFCSTNVVKVQEF